MDKMMLIKLYNEWITKIRKETGIMVKRDFESFLTFLDERGLLRKQVTVEELNEAMAKGSLIIDVVKSDEKGKKNE